MSNEDQSDISYVEEANFIKKLQKGFGKYKGKLPFKCFNCGRIRHFANKCPYPKQEDNDDEEAHNQKDQYKKKFYKKKKNFYSKEDIISSDMSEDEDSELLFMGMNTQNNNIDNEENSESEGEVDLEEELISALEELRKYKKKNKLLRAQLQEFEESHQSREIDASRTIKESEQIISDLKSQLLEAKRIEEVILKQLNDREQVCEKLEAEIELLKGEFEKEKKGSKFENSSKILDEILSSQRSPNNKTGLGYTQDSTSTSQGSVKRPISYADALKGSLRREDNKEKMIPLKTVPHKHKSTLPTKVKDDKKNTITRRNPPNKYLFIGYCYSCNNFGHKAVHCKVYGQYNHRNVQRYKNNKYNTEKRNYNSFSPLQNFNIECQKCNNYGHKASECRLPKYSMKASISNIKENYKKIWRRKDKVQRKKNDEDIAPKFDKIDNRSMMDEVSDKVYENQSYAYKVDQAQDKKTPKEKSDTITELDNVMQVDYPLPNKWKMQKENSQNKDKEAFGAQNNDDDDEPSIGDQPEELSDDDLGNFQTLF
jgi:hypothetical protein